MSSNCLNRALPPHALLAAWQMHNARPEQGLLLKFKLLLLKPKLHLSISHLLTSLDRG